MRKKLRSVTLAALAVAVVLTFGACSQEGPVDTGSTYMPAKMIHGYVSEAGTGDPIIGAWVYWKDPRGIPPGIVIGSNHTNNFGYYEIWGNTEVWDDYEGHDLDGTAEKSGYHDGYNDIDDFDLGSIPYPRDFNLVPE